jgi:hypothetical protein
MMNCFFFKAYISTSGNWTRLLRLRLLNISANVRRIGDIWQETAESPPKVRFFRLPSVFCAFFFFSHSLFAFLFAFCAFVTAFCAFVTAFFAFVTAFCAFSVRFVRL